ncbi:hypothetical protein Tco_0058655 [Tanacetum coccineum]
MVLSEVKIEFKRWETLLCENAICLSGYKDHPNACLVYMLYCLANQRKFNLAYYIAKRMASVIKSDFIMLPYAMLLTRLYRHVLSIHPYLTPNIHILVDHVMVPLTEGRANRIMTDVKRPYPQNTSESSSLPSPTPNKEENDLRPVPSAAKDGSFVQMEPSMSVLQKSFMRFGNNLTTTTITTTLALSLTLPNASQTLPSQPIEASPLAPRTLLFSTPPSSPHPFLNSLDEIPPRSTNPPPLPLNPAYYQTLPHTTLMDFEPSISPTNLSRRSNRMFAQPEPFMSQEQMLKEMGQLQDFSQNIESALRNAQSVQNSLLPPITFSQMPPLPTSHISPPHQQLLSHHFDQSFRHLKPLSHLINLYRLMEPHPSLNLKSTLAPIANGLKLSYMNWSYLLSLADSLLQKEPPEPVNSESQFYEFTLDKMYQFCIRDQALRLTCRNHSPSHEDLTTNLASSFHSSYSFKSTLVMHRGLLAKY